MEFPSHWLPLCIVALVVFCSLWEAAAQCNQRQSSLLTRFKNDLLFNPSYSSKLAYWDLKTDCCQWPGVTCSGQYITALDLSSELIQGGFNESSPLFHLQHLTSLSLANNSFASPIPSSFGKLSNLVHLNLSDAEFHGRVPAQLSNLTKLATLDLSSKYNFGLKVNYSLYSLLGNMSNITELRLDCVNLSTQASQWSQAISSSLPNLQILSLRECVLSGPIHASVQNLTSLSHIDLSYNNFSAPFPHFLSNLPNLTSLSLKFCGFIWEFPEKMFQVKTLKVLDLSYNMLLQGIFPVLSTHSSLEALGLSGIKFSSMIPENIGDLTMLSELGLSGCNFSGHLPDSMSQLSRLVFLDVSENRLSGSVPSFSSSKNMTQMLFSDNQLTGSLLSTRWNELSKLVQVDFSNNSLTGSIPSSLFGIPSLQMLDLRDNRFTGFTNESMSIDTSSSQLVSLYLSNNTLQGYFPTYIFGLQRLEVLDLSLNSFSDILHISSLQRLNNLSILHLSHSNLSVEVGPENSQNHPRLRYLGLSSCRLRAFPGFIKNLTLLDQVDLSENQLYSRIPIWVWSIYISKLNLSHNALQSLGITANLSEYYFALDLSSNQFTGELPSVLPYTYITDLSDNLFTSAIPFANGIASRTVFFSLSNNNLYGSIPESVCNGTSLEILDLSDNFLNGSIPRCLMNISSLGVMNLMRNDIKGFIPDSFASDCNMKTLNLNGNFLQGRIPRSLVRCTSLEVLDLGNNNLLDAFPCWMSSIGSLNVLVLRSNSFQGSILCSNGYSEWPRLQILDIGSNNFSGNLPSKQLLSWQAMVASRSDSDNLHYSSDKPIVFRKYYAYTVLVTLKGLELELTKILTIFCALDFSDNKFLGKIPDQIAHLKSLRALNISGNRMTGEIPESIGNMKNLESLDLARNELNGSIPAELAGLTFLSFLNLSFNQLEGMIPRGSQTQTFSEDSFKGNKGLCGFPLHTKCGNEPGTGTGSGTGTDTETDSSKPSGNARRDIFIAAEVGYAVGLGLIIMPLVFWPRWRMKFFEVTDAVLMRIFSCKL